MAEKAFTARVSEETAEKLNQIIEQINDEVPEAGANAATVLRYAITDYVNRQAARRSKESLFLELPIADLRYEELHKVLDALNTISEVIEQNNEETRKTPQKDKFIRDCNRGTDLLFRKAGEIELINKQK
jgi:PII-like signaling protein